MHKIYYFSTDQTNNKEKNYIYFSILFYVLDIALFFIIGIAEQSTNNIVTGFILIFWLLLTLYLFNFVNFSRITFIGYSLSVAILGIIEEVLVYYNGGGLNGTATSLQQDLILVIPVFVALGVALYLCGKKFGFITPEYYIYGSVYGWILELLIGGKLAYFFLFGGPALVIYGAMLATFAPKEKNQEGKISINMYLSIMIVLVVMFIFMIAGAIVGDTIFRKISKS